LPEQGGVTSPNHNSRGSASVQDADLLDAYLINKHLKDLLEEIQFLRDEVDRLSGQNRSLEHELDIFNESN
jgi:cell shape-determining protein MreC